MNTRDKGKASLVEFLRSIKFAHETPPAPQAECRTHFAHLNSHLGAHKQANVEDSQPVRSAN